jgi:DNA-binding LytR/AlgR family response regulator
VQISIALLEDDPLFALEAERVVTDIGYHLHSTYVSSDEALEKLPHNKPDILIADVFPLGSLNGIEVVKALQLPQLPVIFCTSANLPELYQQAKKLSQKVAYLIKPFDRITLEDAIERAVAAIDRTEPSIEAQGQWDGAAMVGDSFYIKDNQKLIKILFRDIDWLEADGNYTIIQTADKKYALKKSLVSIKKQLPMDQFLQIHKSSVVRLGAIEMVDLAKHIVHVANRELPLGKTFKDHLLENFPRL